MQTVNKLFYDDISGFYDDMINSYKIILSKRNLFRKLIPFWVKTAADIGCGSGNDSIALTLNGVSVTGFDPSANMIKTAKNNAKNHGLNIKFEPSGASDIRKIFYNKFDAALSLGNAIPNIKPSEMKRTFGKIYSILKDKGIFFAQILNYSNILIEQKRIVNITESNDKFFVRFYDFGCRTLVFNVLEFRRKDPGAGKLHSTYLYPYQKSYIISFMKEAGFRNIKCYGDFNLNNFSKATSKDLIIAAVK